MTPIVVSPKADADVNDMLQRLFDLGGPAVARKYAQQLEAIYERLAIFPTSGARGKSLGAETHIAVLSPYVVVYDHVNATVRIIRVIDGRRNITRRLVRE
jgi:plasmid stabilization system protein ParE